MLPGRRAVGGPPGGWAWPSGAGVASGGVGVARGSSEVLSHCGAAHLLETTALVLLRSPEYHRDPVCPHGQAPRRTAGPSQQVDLLSRNQKRPPQRCPRRCGSAARADRQGVDVRLGGRLHTEMPRRVQMETVLLLALLLGAVGAAANQESCPSGELTKDGECCLQCSPGEGVLTPCGATQTVCSPCIDSETFSESTSHTERCQPCTRCGGLRRMKSPCTDTNDAVCVCNYDFYLNQPSGRCERCTRCPEGQGMLSSCVDDRDTVCEACGGGDTFSDQESATEPCLPCTLCDEGGETPSESTVFPDPSLPPDYEVDPDPAGPPPDAGEVDLPATEGPEPVYRGLHDKLIPIYCSILAAVVLGLLAFIIFKRWNSCKQNKQGNSCPGGPAAQQQQATPSPEGEKMHSDSGISVDSQSLQEGHSQSQTVVTVDEEPCLLVPLQTREELEVLESLVLDGGPGPGPGLGEGEWSRLAGLLGYPQDRIDSLRRRQQPLQALLSDWAGQEGADRDLLCSALSKMNRGDLAEKLQPAKPSGAKPSGAKPNATSVV
ncbi:unnamed protein product [Merluccius merluccius]